MLLCRRGEYVNLLRYASSTMYHVDRERKSFAQTNAQMPSARGSKRWTGIEMRRHSIESHDPWAMRHNEKINTIRLINETINPT